MALRTLNLKTWLKQAKVDNILFKILCKKVWLASFNCDILNNSRGEDMIEIILIVVLLVLLVALFVMSYMKRKKFNAEMGQLREELKKGDKVMTDSGIVGEVVDSYVEEDYKYVVLKSGKGENTGFFTVHANAIYYVFGKEMKKEEKKVVVVAPKKEEQKEEK